jgi:hypothetical protein
MLIRAYRGNDLIPVRALLGAEALTDAAGRRIAVAEEGGSVIGAAIAQIDGTSEVVLGRVAAPESRRDVFYQLVREIARAGIDAGLDRGWFTVTDPRLLDRIQRDFDVAPELLGTRDGAPAYWRIEVDLRDALAQLDRAIARIERAG